MKDLTRLPAKVRHRVEVFAFESLPQAPTLNTLGNVEKMQGYPDVYKVRFGSYRVGLMVRDETVYFERVLHRKDIYRYFP